MDGVWQCEKLVGPAGHVPWRHLKGGASDHYKLVGPAGARSLAPLKGRRL